jgi:hypothetical protein
LPIKYADLTVKEKNLVPPFIYKNKPLTNSEIESNERRRARNICHRPTTRRILKYKEDKMPSTAPLK